MQKTKTRLILIILFLLPVYLVKIKFGWASFNALELLVGVLFVVWIFNGEKKYSILNTKYKIPIVLMLTGLFLSIIANENYHIGLGVVKGWFVFPIIFAIIFYDALKKNESLLKKALLTLFSSGVAVSVFGVAYEFLGSLTYDNRLSVFWDSPNQLAMFLAIPFLIGWFLVNQEKEARAKRLYILSLALIGLNLYFAYSYGAWLAIAVALAVISWLEYKEKLRRKYLFMLILFFLIIIGAIGLGKFEQIKNLGNRSSLASREMIWKSAGLMVEKNPIFGIGPGNFQEKYLEYQKYFPPYLEWAVPQPHNIFLAFWLQSGLIGLIGFVWQLILFFRDNKKAIASNRDLGILFLAIMIYILVHGLVDTTYWRNDLAVVFWTAAAANYFIAERNY